MCTVFAFSMYIQECRKALKSGRHRGLTGLICIWQKWGKYKQWNGLLERTTGLDNWTELFSFLDKFLNSFLEAYFL